MTTPMSGDDETLRYPVGRFTYDDSSAVTREAAIETLAELPQRLATAVRGLNDDKLETPYRPGGWTVRQLVHHIADSHMNAYIRFKLALTEDSPTIKPYDEARWAELRDTNELPAALSLQLLELLHRRWVVVLRSMSDADYERGYIHPEQGRLVPLREALALYAWHSRHHVAHITRLRERQGW